MSEHTPPPAKQPPPPEFDGFCGVMGDAVPSRREVSVAWNGYGVTFAIGPTRGLVTYPMARQIRDALTIAIDREAALVVASNARAAAERAERKS